MALVVFSTVPLNPLASDEAGGRGTGSGMIITAVKVTSGPDDHPQLVLMIETSAQNTGTIEGVATFADAGYHSGANLADCDSCGYQVLMPETHDRRRLSPYHKDHFTYQSETDTYLCPQGEVLSYKDSFKHQNGYNLRRYRAQGEVCRACPAFGECTKSIHGRTIRVSEYEPLLQRHRKITATDSSKNFYRRRKALIEARLRSPEGVSRRKMVPLRTFIGGAKLLSSPSSSSRRKMVPPSGTHQRPF